MKHHYDYDSWFIIILIYNLKENKHQQNNDRFATRFNHALPGAFYQAALQELVKLPTTERQPLEAVECQKNGEDIEITGTNSRYI